MDLTLNNFKYLYGYDYLSVAATVYKINGTLDYEF
jgi:NTE family protein